MARRSYGTVRKKSNDRPAEAEASHPAKRLPFAATATTTATRMSAEAALAKDLRPGTSAAATAMGARIPAEAAIASLYCRICLIAIPSSVVQVLQTARHRSDCPAPAAA